MIKPYEDGKLILRILIIAVFVLIIVGYSIFQAQKIVEGPQLTVSTPIDGSVMTQGSVDVVGVAKNISGVFINGRSIVTDESGNFSEKLMLYPGYNIIKLNAEDKFGAKTEKSIEVVYQQ